MIPIDRSRIDRHFLTARNLPQQFTASPSNIPSQHRITVLRHPYQVILTIPYRMTSTLVIFHASILTRHIPMSPEGEGFTEPLSGTLNMIAVIQTVVRLLAELGALVLVILRPRRSIEAENLVLRRQIALYKERGIKPRRIDAATRMSLAWLSRCCDWRSCLTIVRRETVIRWHRAG
jgi:hypothetical protein